MTTKELLGTFTREEGIALFNTKKTDKEVYDILVSKGLTDSFDTFTAEAQNIFNEKFSKMSKEEVLAQIEGAELTDEQLEQIAGGKSDGATAGIAIGSTLGSGIASIAIAGIIFIEIGSTAAAGAGAI